MDMSNELKPCPLCKGNRVMLNDWLYGWFATCIDCYAITPLITANMDVAISMWNNGNVITEEDFKACQQELLDNAALIPKSCPFCGINPNVHHYKSEDVFPSGYTDNPYSCEIECPECDYVGAEGSGMTEREAFKDALDKWNRRME